MYAIRKYGKAAFELSVLATACTVDELNELERLHIKAQNTLVPNGYNIQPGGNGYEILEETRLKRVANGLGRKHTPETKAKIAAAHLGVQTCLGHHHSEETKAKMSVSAMGLRNALGAVRSPETRAKISASSKGKSRNLGVVRSPETRAKMSAVAKNLTALGGAKCF